MNEHIIKTGLIGTSRQALEPNRLNQAVKEIIEIGEYKNEEEKYLSALALEVYYHEAGQLGKLYVGESLDLPITEILPVMGKSLTTALGKILEMEGRTKSNLLFFLAQRAIEAQVIVPVNMIIPVLKAGKEIVQNKRSAVLHLVGNKGRKICQDNESYSKAYRETTDGNIWELGSQHERRAYFATMLENNEKRAIEMLMENWGKESIKEKVDFLTILSKQGSNESLPFLEDLYFNEFKFDSKEKKTVTKGRYVIASKLLSLDSSKLFQETINELSNYLKTFKSQGFFKKMLSLNQTPIELPQGQDSFWNPEHMMATYGFSDSNPDIGQFATDNLYWFACFVEAIPMVSWASLFNLSLKETFKFFTEDDSFQNIVNGVKSSNLRNSLYHSGIATKDIELIELLLSSSNFEQNLELVSYFPKHKWEEYIVKNDLFLNNNALESFPRAEYEEWSIAFTQKWLRALKSNLSENRGLNYTHGSIVAEAFNITCVDELDHIQNTTAQASQFYQIWNRYIYLPIKQTVEIKKLIIH